MRRLSLGNREASNCSDQAVSGATLPRCSTRSSCSQQPNHSPNLDEEILEEEETSEEIWFRGPTRVPPQPTREEDKPVLTPVGDRQWRANDYGGNIRVPNSILTLLLKQWFPGIVTLKGKEEPAWSWKHYRIAPDTPRSNQIRLPSCLHRVEEDFWLYFRWAEGKEQEARKVVHNCVKGLVDRLFYETRILAVLNYQRKILKVNTSREIACRTYLTESEYLKVEPWWFLNSENAWRELIRLRWCNPKWQAVSRAHRIRREKMKGPSHRQGSANLSRYQKNLEKKKKRPVAPLEAYTEGRRENREDGQFSCDPRVAEKLEAYAAAYVQLHGPENDWRTSPIDPVAVHMAGGGKKHGRFMIGDGLIDSSAVFGDNSRDDQRPRRRLRTDHDNTNQVEDLLRQLQEEREAREREREEREREKERERQEKEQEKECEREERAREKEQERKEREEERKERELEKIASQQKSAFFEAALRVIQSKLNIDLSASGTPPLPVMLTHLASSGPVASNGNSGPNHVGVGAASGAIVNF
ncbi:autonomous transposable element EN-1 mosaic protein [Oryza sativa Japonica Group]|nr:calponin homology domain-containing protein DDB_G0272472 [Oryza sativa Japonica Group]XP_015610890.1 calponin homology domain-containing protein DDB_G0272472 [Oryza sativa Japonica Group]BAD28572.1 transposase-like [Oryza sativa Japonica Group]BAF24864.1 Os09g0348800 [Oryza sativa Japonica Group]BAG88688.1 unnamed protein product [Oryza sativa Japonica Group]|eukprot:NP_001062950.1 Os09g0348800 [Oryza sativa Japonica Group]